MYILIVCKNRAYLEFDIHVCTKYLLKYVENKLIDTLKPVIYLLA